MMKRKKIFVYLFSLLLPLFIYWNLNLEASNFQTTTSTNQNVVSNQNVLDAFLVKAANLRKTLNDDTKYENALISLNSQIKVLSQKYSHNSTIWEMITYLNTGISNLQKDLSSSKDVTNFLCELNGNCNSSQTGTTVKETITNTTTNTTNTTTTPSNSVNSCKYTYTLQDFDSKNCGSSGWSIRSSSATNLSDYALIKEWSKTTWFYCQYIHDTFSRKYVLQSDNGSCNLTATDITKANQNSAQNDNQKAQAEQQEKEKQEALLKQKEEEAAKQKEIADRLTFASYSKEAKAGEQVTVYWKAGESYNSCYLMDKIDSEIITNSVGIIATTVGRVVTTDWQYNYTMPNNNTTLTLKCKRGTSFSENFSEKQVQITIKK